VIGVARERIRIALEAPAAAYRPGDAAGVAAAARRLGLPEGARWIVYVGGFNPHKRIDLLVQVHAELVKEMGADAPYLILVGSAERDSFHKDVGAIRQMIETMGSGERVRWPGFVPDEELRQIHTGAVALVLASECEGFGLPAIEAAACGAPVIATVESPLPDLLDGGGVFVRPGNAVELKTALRTLLTDEPARQVMGARARTRANELTWTRSASAVLAALREAAGRRGPAWDGSALRRARRLEAAR
jgi:glycosyltransferase involved in cell wall biosynthesis